MVVQLAPLVKLSSIFTFSTDSLDHVIFCRVPVGQTSHPLGDVTVIEELLACDLIANIPLLTSNVSGF